jgi:hypothetical protein
MTPLVMHTAFPANALLSCISARVCLTQLPGMHTAFPANAPCDAYGIPSKCFPIMHTAFLANVSLSCNQHLCQWCIQHLPTKIWPIMRTSSPT